MTTKHHYADIEAEFNEALRRRDAGDLDGARVMLEELAERRPEAAFVLGMLGDVYERLGRIRRAAQNYSLAVHLAPRSRLASLSLFHALHELGDLGGALGEARRFVSLRRSEEHEQLIRAVERQIENSTGTD